MRRQGPLLQRISAVRNAGLDVTYDGGASLDASFTVNKSLLVIRSSGFAASVIGTGYEPSFETSPKTFEKQDFLVDRHLLSSLE